MSANHARKTTELKTRRSAVFAVSESARWSVGLGSELVRDIAVLSESPRPLESSAESTPSLSIVERMAIAFSPSKVEGQLNYQTRACYHKAD
jgi:hypothetical protein